MKPFITFIASVAVLALMPLKGFASGISDLDLLIGGKSYHFDRSQEYNEENWLIGAQLGPYSLAYYKNSHDGDTVVLTKELFNYWVTDNFRVGTMAGVATGYTSGGEPMIASMIKLSYFTEDWVVDAHVLPIDSGVIQMQARWRLGKVKHWTPPEDFNWSVGYGFGTMGGTLDLTYKLSERLNLRASVSNVKYNWDDEWNHWDKGAELWQQEFFHVSNYGINLDYYFKGNFGVYAGLMYNNSEYSTIYHTFVHGGKGQCGSVNLVSDPMTVCHGDKLRGVVDWDKPSLAFGLRYGNPFNQDGWGWYLNVGVQTFTGISGKATFTGNGNVPQDKLDYWVNEKEEPKYDKYNFGPDIKIGIQF